MPLRLTGRRQVIRKRSRWGSVGLDGPVVGPDGVYVGWHTDINELVKLDRKTLEEVWRVKTQRYIPRAIEGTDLLAGSYKGRVGRFDGRTGKLLWEVPGDGFIRWREHLVIPEKGGLAVVDAKGGAIIEKIPMPSPDLAVISRMGDLMLLKVDLLIEERDGRPEPIVCFDLAERRIVWEQPLIAQLRERFGADEQGGIIALTPGSAGDRFVARRGHGTFGISAVDGRVLWSVPLPLDYRVAHVYDGRVHGLVADRFVALDESDGRVLFDVQHPELAGSMFPGLPIYARGQVAYAMQSGHVAVLSLTDGTLKGLHRYRGPLSGFAAEADGRLLVASSDDGSLLVFEGL
jgi:outer membrane protein assembly factor BamB